MNKTFKQLLCLFGILTALTLTGCNTIHRQESQGGPVVAPTTIQQQQNQGGDVDFGKEKYIWDDWQ